ncbi:MAG: cell division protein ZapA [Alphaproteobacteria bacterium]|nr:cell division protein ZapA [Alphaproteobacteria bacterium]
MAQVTLTVNNTPYQFTCSEGEQERLRELAQTIDQRVVQLAGALGQVGEAKLILMASIIMLDEVNESGGARLSQGDLVSHLGDLDSLAGEIEHIAGRLESA